MTFLYLINIKFTDTTTLEQEKEEINEFMSKDTEVIFKEISSFVQEYNLTHQQIAEMISNENGINISNYPIRKYLARENISYYSKTLIFQWYLRNSKNPTIFEKILKERKSEKEKVRAQIDEYFASIIDPRKEIKEIEDLKQIKGEEFWRDEIRDFTHKHQIYRYEIEEMTGLATTTLRRFFNKTPTTEKTSFLVYRWYFRYSKHPQIFQQAFSVTDINKSINIIENQSVDNGNRSRSTTGMFFIKFLIHRIYIFVFFKTPI